MILKRFAQRKKKEKGSGTEKIRDRQGSRNKLEWRAIIYENGFGGTFTG